MLKNYKPRWTPKVNYMMEVLEKNENEASKEVVRKQFRSMAKTLDDHEKNQMSKYGFGTTTENKK